MAEEVFPSHRDRARKALGGAVNEDIESGAQLVADVAQAIAEAEARGENRMHGRVRVLRVLEYVYPSAEAMVADMGNWGIQSMRRMNGTCIRSTVMPPEVLP